MGGEGSDLKKKCILKKKHIDIIIPCIFVTFFSKLQINIDMTVAMRCECKLFLITGRLLLFLLYF